MTEARLLWHLDNWSRYMSGWVGPDTYPHRSLVCSNGGASNDFDDMVSTEDRRVAKIVDVVISDLSPIHRAAVSHKWLRAVYRFPRNNLPELLDAAYEAISSSLDRRGVY